MDPRERDETLKKIADLEARLQHRLKRKSLGHVPHVTTDQGADRIADVRPRRVRRSLHDVAGSVSTPTEAGPEKENPWRPILFPRVNLAKVWSRPDEVFSLPKEYTSLKLEYQRTNAIMSQNRLPDPDDGDDLLGSPSLLSSRKKPRRRPRKKPPKAHFESSSLSLLGSDEQCAMALDKVEHPRQWPHPLLKVPSGATLTIEKLRQPDLFLIGIVSPSEIIIHSVDPEFRETRMRLKVNISLGSDPQGTVIARCSNLLSVFTLCRTERDPSSLQVNSHRYEVSPDHWPFKSHHSTTLREESEINNINIVSGPEGILVTFTSGTDTKIVEMNHSCETVREHLIQNQIVTHCQSVSGLRSCFTGLSNGQLRLFCWQPFGSLRQFKLGCETHSLASWASEVRSTDGRLLCI